MTLREYMDWKKISLEEMAELIGDVSVSGLKKWLTERKDKRVPRPHQQRRVFKITDGKVTPNDWVMTVEKKKRKAS